MLLTLLSVFMLEATLGDMVPDNTFAHYTQKVPNIELAKNFSPALLWNIKALLAEERENDT